MPKLACCLLGLLGLAGKQAERILSFMQSFTYGHRQLLEEPLMVGNVTQRFKVVREQEGAGDNITIDVKEFILKQNRRPVIWLPFPVHLLGYECTVSPAIKTLSDRIF